MPDPELTKWFIAQGAIGVMALISIIVNIVLWKSLQKAQDRTVETQDARLADQKEDRKDRLDVDRRIATSLELINDKIQVGKAR